MTVMGALAAQLHLCTRRVSCFFIDEVPVNIRTRRCPPKSHSSRIADRLGCSAKTVFQRLQPARSAVGGDPATACSPSLPSWATRAPIRSRRACGAAGWGAIGFAYANPLSYAFEDPVSVALLAGISAVAEGEGAGLLLVPGSADGGRSSADGGRRVDALSGGGHRRAAHLLDGRRRPARERRHRAPAADGSGG